MLFKKLKARLLRAEGEILIIKEELNSIKQSSHTSPHRGASDCASLIDEWMNGGTEE